MSAMLIGQAHFTRANQINEILLNSVVHSSKGASLISIGYRVQEIRIYDTMNCPTQTNSMKRAAFTCSYSSKSSIAPIIV